MTLIMSFTVLSVVYAECNDDAHHTESMAHLELMNLSINATQRDNIRTTLK